MPPYPNEVRRARDLGAQAYLTKFPASAELSELLAHASVYRDAGEANLRPFELPHNLLNQ